MKTYLVGGAVRDRLLGIAVKDRDYVVVGATPDELLALHFKPVGKDFPVFLHPQTSEEYALARTERKTGRGYHGFAFDTDPGVTLEDDLRRRDLTINAIAEDENGALVDPFDGASDLRNGMLRHVSPAFAEDPVRILRVARFAARYASRGIPHRRRNDAVDDAMVESGEADHLVPERVWAETQKALTEPTPSAFVRALRDCGALRVLMPEVDALYGVPQRAEFHPEVDTGIHVEMVLDMAAQLAPGDALIGWCALTHDLGKALTPADVLPSHRGHEHAGIEPIKTLSARLKVPAEFAALAQLVCKLHLLAHTAFELRAIDHSRTVRETRCVPPAAPPATIPAGVHGRQARPQRHAGRRLSASAAISPICSTPRWRRKRRRSSITGSKAPTSARRCAKHDCARSATRSQRVPSARESELRHAARLETVHERPIAGGDVERVAVDRRESGRRRLQDHAVRDRVERQIRERCDAVHRRDRTAAAGHGRVHVVFCNVIEFDRRRDDVVVRIFDRDLHGRA